MDYKVTDKQIGEEIFITNTLHILKNAVTLLITPISFISNP